MKKMNAKRVYKVALRLLLCVLICVIIALVPTIIVTTKNPIWGHFTSKRSNYQGVLEIWNIDTFEGGTAGKLGYLKTQVINFEKNNRGLYFLVRNMTETECVLAIENGQTPAMFSFGVGVGEKVLPYLQKTTANPNGIRQDVLVAGQTNGEQLALAWCRGAYALISTADKLEKAKQDSSQSLSAIATNCGYTVSLKNNKMRTTYSLAFGSAGYVCPQRAYATSHKNLVQNQTSMNIDNFSKTPYSAYCDFIEGKASILLGTQRDVARVENRITQGKLEGVIIECLSAYTDLVQYIGLAKGLSAGAQSACNKFMEFLLGESAQKDLSNIGMLSVLDGANIYEKEGFFKELELASNSPCTVPNAFISLSEISASKQSCIDVEAV